MSRVDALPPRIAAKISTDAETGCWVWMRAVAENGYGIEPRPPAGKSRLAHRVVYSLLVGPIPDGMVIDHVCFNRKCVNPQHLRHVRQKQNAEHRQGLNANNSSGVRGVSWGKRDKRWRVSVRHNRIQINGGHFTNLAEAEAAAIALRAKLFTHQAVGK